MSSLIMAQIEKRAKENGGDMNKAIEEYFPDHPKFWPQYIKEFTVPVGATVKD